MSELRPFVDSILALAAPAANRNSGTRLLMVVKVIADCLKPVGPDPQKQLARLDQFETEVHDALQPNAGEFLSEVMDLISTQKRHLGDQISS